MQVSLIKLRRDSKHDGLNTKHSKTYGSLYEVKWRTQFHEWLTVVKYHFRSGTEHCLPLLLCLYSASTKVKGAASARSGDCSLFFPHFPIAHTHHHHHFLSVLQSAFPEDTEEAVVLLSTLPPPSLSRSVVPWLLSTWKQYGRIWTPLYACELTMKARRLSLCWVRLIAASVSWKVAHTITLS